MRNSECERCGKVCRNYGVVTLSDSERRYSETICGDCYNKEMSEVL